jgi:prepilin-type N-terminal cleavage/methylation domain-containing protein/prepilin-type processing-associated H-X9-DG protein
MDRRLVAAWTQIGMRKRSDAFTLVELLVVIAIIAVLAGLILSVFGKVQVLRQRTESAARLRQWGAALAAYVIDNNGSLPRRGQGVQPVTQLDRPTDWFNALPPYLGLQGYGALIEAGQRPQAGDHSLFVRPGAADPGGPVFLSYGMNMNLSPWNLSAPTGLAQIALPATTVFLAETPGPYSSTYPSVQPYSCLAPYNGTGNILFLDGHVSAFTAAYLGVNTGDPQRADVRWLTGTASDAQAGQY